MTCRFSSRKFHLWPTAILACVAIASSSRGETPTETRILVDFEQPSKIQVHTIDATAQRIQREEGNALEVVNGVNSNWPSVTIRPTAGQWNLSGFYAVEIDVHNPENESIRVLLSVRSPSAGGGNDENAESVTVPARGTATLQVPFGFWHGETNRPIDQANIVSAAVLLDRPKRSHRFVVDNLRAVSFGSRAAEVLMATDFFQQLKPVLGRGVNLGNMLEAPREGQWGVRVEDEYFDLIQSAGFDSVRIPVRWSAHAAKEPPYSIDPAFLDRVEHVVRQAMSHGLRAVLNMHHYEEIFHQPDEHAGRFCAIWGQIAQRFQDYPESLYFELLNEPHDKLTADRWDKLAAEALAVVRKSNPTRTVVIGPANWNNVNALDSLVLPEDANLIGTFHYYLPFKFTHQGAGWVGQNANQWLGTRWTGTPAERQAVINDLDKALAWSVKHRRPIYLGEFGAYSKADMESRARWTRFVATEAAKRKIAFAYWEFCAGFGVYDPDRKAWREPLKDALLPSTK